MKTFLESEGIKALSRTAKAVGRLSKHFEGLEAVVNGIMASSGMDELGGLGTLGGVGGLGSAANDRAAKGAEAAVTGGSKSTTININLGKMVENIVFNGGLRENAQDLERQVTEIMYRVLAMAATV